MNDILTKNKGMLFQKGYSNNTQRNNCILALMSPLYKHSVDKFFQFLGYQLYLKLRNYS